VAVEGRRRQESLVKKSARSDKRPGSRGKEDLSFAGRLDPGKKAYPGETEEKRGGRQ